MFYLGMPNMQSKQQTECPRKHIVIQQNHQCSDQDKAVQYQQQAGGEIVSIALDMHDKHRFGSQYSDPEGTFKTIIGMLGFVDDNNISNTGENMSLSKM